MEESSSEQVVELKRMSLSDIFGSMFSIYGKGFILFSVITILGSIISWAFSVVWFIRIFNSIDFYSIFNFQDPGSVPALEPSFDPFNFGVFEIAGFGVLVILSWILSAWMNGALVHMASMIYTGDPANFGASLKQATKRIWKMLGAYLMLTLILLVPAIAIGALFIASAMLLPVAGFIVMLICSPVMIYFYVKWSLIAQAVYIENKGPLEAISRSSSLVKDYWWLTFGYFLVLGLLSGGISIALGFIPFIGQIAATIITTPLMAIGATLIYWNLRARWENVTLEKAKEELAVTGD